ncbi:membrane dipeptidase [Marinobacter zhejiangensis]|uniref:Membrane dipeptidase (Peptidase family M19) n=1 Tax=Marinobacter zhejiangensis TaxID=488535 RepID=A0A1I4M5D2_9GAMM|nr:membrane dipeptidase [Marinobacter zhejiangensis]SFL98558.1 Membrane dipeptidase (Peptidase family M19) [Marinobacter zhejiangensis]
MTHSIQPCFKAWLLGSTLLLSACGGGGDADTPQPANAPDPVLTAPDASQGGQVAGETIQQPAAITRYQFANGCYQLQQGDHYLATTAAEDQYSITSDPAQATEFYFKPTSLGRYLLLSDYQRGAGQQGSKALLGISDPVGEFLDGSGNFIGEVSYLVAGLGDMANFLLDPISPLGDAIRDLGESLELGGDRIGDINVNPQLGLVTEASDLTVWELLPTGDDRFQLSSQVTGLLLTASDEGTGLVSPSLAGETSKFSLVPANSCASYPEAELNAFIPDKPPAIYLREVDRFRGTPGIDNDDIYGFVDAHSHITAYEFIGGRVNYGDPFHKFGVDHALDDCAVNHGPEGLTGLIEHVTSTLGPHETQGWPTFNYWPRNNSLQHHQSYYRWIERTHLAGMKVLVNHLVHNEILCQLNPQKQNDCDTMPALELQAQRMHEMQDYIDAQNGGPGKGWFRLVTSPAQAREVIADGKLAVVLGVETSKVFNCGEFQGIAECTRDQIIERLDRLYAMGVRNLFPVHKFDNAFAGHLPDLSEGVGIGPVLYAGNLAETGHPIEFETCPAEADEYSGLEPDQNPNPLGPLGLMEQLLFQLDYLGDRFPESPEEFAEYDPRAGTDHLCNRRGLSDLGEFLVQELMRRGMMIETDHISRKAAARILEMTGNFNYPVINSHGGWGGTERLRDRIAAQGGVTSSFASVREHWVQQLNRDGGRVRDEAFMVGPYGGAGMASDVNGIAALAGNPGSPEQAEELYPFASVDGRVIFQPQRTGDHEFRLYDGRGVAHYGLYPDQIEDMIRFSDSPREQVNEAVNQLFTSAEAYLRMWERAEQAAR